MSSSIKIGDFPLSRLGPSKSTPQEELSPTVVWLARLMDDAFAIPGTNYRIGWDGLIGLIPGVGDLAMLLVSGIFLQEAQRLGVSRWVTARMIGNYAVDFLVGLVPLVGDFFDIGFKANRRNLRLLQQHLEREAARRGSASVRSL